MKTLGGLTTNPLTIPPPSPPVLTTVKGKVQQKMRDPMNVNFKKRGGGVDPKVYISKKFIHSEKRLQNGFVSHKNVFW